MGEVAALQKPVKVPMVCQKCLREKRDGKVFWLLVVATDITFSQDADMVEFNAPDYEVNLESFKCFECDEPCNDLEGLWQFTARRVE